MKTPVNGTQTGVYGGRARNTADAHLADAEWTWFMGRETRVGWSDYGRVVTRSVSLGSSCFPRDIFVRGAERRSAMATATG
jgi:hypothetical protein